jgi:hypothetical protein
MQPEDRRLQQRQWPRLEKLVGKEALHVVRDSGRKFLFTNH